MNDVSDHYGTMTKISNVPLAKDTSNVYIRKSNLTDKQWELFNGDLYDILTQRLPGTESSK